MRLRVRFRRQWRAREVVVVELRERVQGLDRDRYAGQLGLGRDGRIPLAGMCALGERVVLRLGRLGLHKDQVAVLLRSLACTLFTVGWYREHARAEPVAANVVEYGKLVFGRVERTLEVYRDAL